MLLLGLKLKFVISAAVVVADVVNYCCRSLLVASYCSSVATCSTTTNDSKLQGEENFRPCNNMQPVIVVQNYHRSCSCFIMIVVWLLSIIVSPLSYR